MQLVTHFTPNKKTIHNQQLSNERLPGIEQYAKANLSIEKKKQYFDNSKTEAYEKNVDEIIYVEIYLNDKNDELRWFHRSLNIYYISSCELQTKSEYYAGYKI